jgi:hypothetical protein
MAYLSESEWTLTEPEAKQLDYVHFDTEQQLDIYLVNNPHLVVSHFCCGKKGIAVEKKAKSQKVIQSQVPSTVGTCDICFLEGVKLYKSCQSCIQPFCRECLEKIVSKVCPYCRGKLRNNI